MARRIKLGQKFDEVLGSTCLACGVFFLYRMVSTETWPPKPEGKKHKKRKTSIRDSKQRNDSEKERRRSKAEEQAGDASCARTHVSITQKSSQAQYLADALPDGSSETELALSKKTGVRRCNCPTLVMITDITHKCFSGQQSSFSFSVPVLSQEIATQIFVAAELWSEQRTDLNLNRCSRCGRRFRQRRRKNINHDQRHT